MRMRKLRVAVATTVTLAIGVTETLAAGKSDGTGTDYMPRVTGMVNLRYAYDEANKDAQGFDVRRVRLGVRGNLHKKVDYVMQAEYAGSVRLLDAYLRWKLRPEINFQVGEFKIPYSQEALCGPANWLSTELPTAVSKLNGYSDLSGQASHKNGRDIGLMVYGSAIHKEDFDVLRYRLGVFNGNGINVKDDNRKKDVAAMLWVSPVRQLSFTGSYYSGSYGPKGADHVRNRASAGVEWKDAKLMVRHFIHPAERSLRPGSLQGAPGGAATAELRLHEIRQPQRSPLRTQLAGRAERGTHRSPAHSGRIHPLALQQRPTQQPGHAAMCADLVMEELKSAKGV